MANLADNDFVLFGLTEQFAQDLNLLTAKWKALQREAHPDKFAAQGAASQRLAMQWSVRINEGYQRLKDPLKRAAYLCELRGAPINAENNTAMPPTFLSDQIGFREALDEAVNAATKTEAYEKLFEMQLGLIAFKEKIFNDCEQLLDANANEEAAKQVRMAMFFAAFDIELQKKIELFES